MRTSHPSPNEIVEKIAKSFETLPKRLATAKGNAAWTKQLKHDLGTLGKKNGWGVCTAGFKDQFENAWLYDLIWYKEDGGCLSEVYLVLESEWAWGRALIKYDFEKLLLAKSTLKVMIFQSDSKGVDDLFDFLEKGIRAFTKLQCGDETYVLICYNNDTDKFDIRQYRGTGDRIAKRVVKVAK
jgi:hypothetical protein